jgi:hypothetical protein
MQKLRTTHYRPTPTRCRLWFRPSVRPAEGLPPRGGRPQRACRITGAAPSSRSWLIRATKRFGYPAAPHRSRSRLTGCGRSMAQHCPARGPPLIRLGPVLPETAVALLTAQHSSRIGIQAGDGGHGRQSIVSQQRRARSAQTEPAFRSQLTPMVRRLCHGSLFRRRPARGRGEGRAVAQSTERPSADL